MQSKKTHIDNLLQTQAEYLRDEKKIKYLLWLDVDFVETEKMQIQIAQAQVALSLDVVTELLNRAGYAVRKNVAAKGGKISPELGIGHLYEKYYAMYLGKLLAEWTQLYKMSIKTLEPKNTFLHNEITSNIKTVCRDMGINYRVVLEKAKQDVFSSEYDHDHDHDAYILKQVDEIESLAMDLANIPEWESRELHRHKYDKLQQLKKRFESVAGIPFNVWLENQLQK